MLYNLYGSNIVFMICKDANAGSYFENKFKNGFYEDDSITVVKGAISPNDEADKSSEKRIDMFIKPRICGTVIRVESKYADTLEEFLNCVTFKN